MRVDSAMHEGAHIGAGETDDVFDRDLEDGDQAAGDEGSGTVYVLRRRAVAAPARELLALRRRDVRPDGLRRDVHRLAEHQRAYTARGAVARGCGAVGAPRRCGGSGGNVSAGAGWGAPGRAHRLRRKGNLRAAQT